MAIWIQLFKVQRNALPKILSDKGAVVSLPTSSGKTRIAEIAILQCLSQDPNAKILYLAPFRSLAYEIETILNQTFDILNINVSQLYGSGQFSRIDKTVIEQANILIATPEKAKVLLRADEEIVSMIKLIIIDEGHLLDESKRNVTNELFIEELKLYISRNRGKIILLSAVLPNTEHIANWICNDCDLFTYETERVSRQRLGILEYKNNSVKLEWFGEVKSFNPNFISPIKTEKKAKGIIKVAVFPSNKKQAVAFTALKLSIKNPLLIFIASASSVLSYAEAIYNMLKLNNELIEHEWKNKLDWDLFEIQCAENESKENKNILKYAKYGIICHKGKVSREIRLAIERLMRNGNPRIIVATTTLGQGVNLGISTVIFAEVSYYDINTQKRKTILHKDFWNIAGRAGRAFIDTEGKVLFASENSSDTKQAINYFNKLPDNTYSGLLMQIDRLKKISLICKIDFANLLELIANNDLEVLAEWTYDKTEQSVKEDFQDVFDWIDDTLLFFEMQSNNYPKRSLDDYFRSTLAYIQAKEFKKLDQEDIIDFLKARSKAIREKIAPDKYKWKTLISLGLPLASALKLEELFNEILQAVEDYITSNRKINDKIIIIKRIEVFTRSLPSSAFKLRYDANSKPEFDIDNIDTVRRVWLSGDSLSEVQKVKNYSKICNEYFGYTLPWVLGAISNRCKQKELSEQANIFEELAVCCELGLPSFMAAKIYLSGIRSRISATELSETLDFSVLVDENTKLADIKDYLISNINSLKEEVENPLTKEWLQIFENENIENRHKPATSFPKFTLSNSVKIKSSRLFVKQFDKDNYYLCSPNYEDKVLIESSEEFPFNQVANKPNTFFKLVGDVWEIRTI